MEVPVYIGGLGVISAIGNNVGECLHALETGLAGIGEVKYLETVHREKIPVAEVKFNNNELASRAGLSPSVSRTALLSIIAAQEALQDAAIPEEDRWRTGFISANTVGGMDKTETFFPPFLSTTARARLRDVIHHECGSVTELAAEKLGIKDYVTTISTACSSSANAIFFGARLIKQGMLDVVVAGGTDALTKFTLNGFNTLMILDHQLCTPKPGRGRGLRGTGF
jgi:3-oxoacyl-(acyl-carrier-protein) synthase